MSEQREPRPLTQRQRDIIDRLERALYAANKAGIAICGMDSELLAYRADDFDRLAEETSTYDAQDTLQNESKTGISIEHNGAYRDSGGW